MHFVDVGVVKRMLREIVMIARKQQALTVGGNVVEMDTFASKCKSLRETTGKVYQIECTAVSPTGLAIVGCKQLFERPLGAWARFIGGDDGKLARRRQSESSIRHAVGDGLLVHGGRIQHNQVFPGICAALEVKSVGFRHPRSMKIIGRAE